MPRRRACIPQRSGHGERPLPLWRLVVIVVAKEHADASHGGAGADAFPADLPVPRTSAVGAVGLLSHELTSRSSCTPVSSGVPV